VVSRPGKKNEKSMVENEGKKKRAIDLVEGKRKETNGIRGERKVRLKRKRIRQLKKEPRQMKEDGGALYRGATPRINFWEKRRGDTFYLTRGEEKKQPGEQKGRMDSCLCFYKKKK